MDNLEIRSFNIELRDEPESRHIEGYGSVFNERSLDLGGFVEMIAPGAFDGVIERSDVKCYLDHNPGKGILARSRNGKGSLSLGVDEKGLQYSFDAPKTSLGDEVVEGLKRGDYSQSSFAFTVDDEVWTKEADGTYLRTITKIGGLYDVSIVANPAYEGTSVALRSLDAFKAQEEIPAEVKEEEPKTEDVNEGEVKETEPEEEKKEETVEEVLEEEKKEDEENKEPEVQEETEPKENRNNINNTKNIHMSNFSLIKSINDVIANRNINEDALGVIEMGATEMRKSGLSFSGQIQLPVEERGDAVAATVATDGKEIVATDKLNILSPLMEKSILAEAGTTFLTGLVGNISIPTYTGSTCGWKGELEAADNGKGNFGSVELSPKRLTAYIDISKQFLAQDSVGAEEMLRADIVNALVSKLESTIFGDAAGDTTKPAGIFNSAEVVAPSYQAVCDAEAAVKDYSGEKRFVMGPSAKSAFKQATISGTKSDLRLLLEDGEVDGYPVSDSSNVVTGGYAFGDFSELVVAQWGGIDIVVDPYTLATKNAIRLVINAYFDAKVRRDGAIKAYKIA